MPSRKYRTKKFSRKSSKRVSKRFTKKKTRKVSRKTLRKVSRRSSRRNTRRSLIKRTRASKNYVDDSITQEGGARHGQPDPVTRLLTNIIHNIANPTFNMHRQNEAARKARKAEEKVEIILRFKDKLREESRAFINEN